MVVMEFEDVPDKVKLAIDAYRSELSMPSKIVMAKRYLQTKGAHQYSVYLETISLGAVITLTIEADGTPRGEVVKHVMLFGEMDYFLSRLPKEDFEA